MCNYVGSHHYQIGTVKLNDLISFNGMPGYSCLDTKHVAAANDENNTKYL